MRELLVARLFLTQLGEGSLRVCASVHVCFVVNELSEGGPWSSLVATVCIYTLLKFLQGGGAGGSCICVFVGVWFC